MTIQGEGHIVKSFDGELDQLHSWNSSRAAAPRRGSSGDHGGVEGCYRFRTCR
jgi:hypothetical protein